MTFSFLNQISSQTFWTVLFFIDLFMITFVAIYGFYAYYRRLSELKKIQIDTHKKSEEILRETQDKAKEILERVEHKADEILTHSELFKNDLNSAFQNSLKGSSQKYLEMVEVQSKRFISDYENLLTSVKKQSLEKAGKALDLIEQDIQRSLVESKGTFKSEVMRSLKEALQEIESFKQMEMDKIDQDIDKVVVQIAKEVLRTSITPKDHKKMVLQALDKAKEQGMFFL